MTTPTWPREPWHVHKGELANEGRTFVKTDHNNGYKRWVAETTCTVGRDGSRADEATARRIASSVTVVAGVSTASLDLAASRFPRDPVGRLRFLAGLAGALQEDSR